jgi:hypothetical protein
MQTYPQMSRAVTILRTQAPSVPTNKPVSKDERPQTPEDYKDSASDLFWFHSLSLNLVEPAFLLLFSRSLVTFIQKT